MVSRRRLTAAAAVVGAGFGAAGCNAIFGLTDRPLLSDAGTDASMTLHLPDSAGGDDAPPPPVCPPAGSSGYHSADVTDCWTTLNLASVGISAQGFEGAAFDGRFVYLVPNPGSVVVRYDTTLAFTSKKAWTDFDVSAIVGGPITFAGAVFDGRGLMLVPSGVGSFLRYDTQSGFQDPSSWTSLSPSTGLDASMPYGFAGGVFDGNESYFVPDASEWMQEYAKALGVFTDVSNWSAHNINGADNTGPGFVGAAFDGRYVYLSPGTVDPDSVGIGIQYDTTASFTLNGSFQTFDMTLIDPGAASCAGAAFDGKYVYFVPSGLSGGDAVFLRFDSSGSLADAGSWEHIDLSDPPFKVGHFFGAAFDGRFLYLVPSGTTSVGPNGRLAVFDTTADFSSAASWTTFDTNTIHAASFQGSAFDGRYLYLAPQSNGVVARFEARSSPRPATLPGFFGSFF